MEKRTTRSSSRLAAAAANKGNNNNNNNNPEHNEKNDEGTNDTAPGVAEGIEGIESAIAAGDQKRKSQYKANAMPKTAKEAANKRVKEDAQLRKQRRDELVSAKRFKRFKDQPETGGDEEVELGKDQLDSVQALLKSEKTTEKVEALKTVSEYLTNYSESRALQTLVSSKDFVAILE
ncbi:hypothetical protein BGZ91_009107, partial [Linnemannia elongata]